MAEAPASVLEELYAVLLSAFTRERNARAAALKRAGDADTARAVQALRKPTATLWATNQLARAEPERLERFVDSVERVRRSQLRDGRAAAEAMRAQRAELDALVERAEELLKGAGFRASPDTTREISNTLLGAAVDPQRAKDLRRGRLTEPLGAPGFEVLAGAPAGGHLRLLPGRPPTRGPAPRRPRPHPPPASRRPPARQARRAPPVICDARRHLALTAHPGGRYSRPARGTVAAGEEAGHGAIAGADAGRGARPHAGGGCDDRREPARDGAQAPERRARARARPRLAREQNRRAGGAVRYRRRGAAMSDEIAYATIRELGTRYRSRQLSPVEVTQALLARIEKLDPVLSAFVTLTADRARADARAAEEALRHGDTRPLLGIPVAHKDIYLTRGIRTTGGSALLADWLP